MLAVCMAVLSLLLYYHYYCIMVIIELSLLLYYRHYCIIVIITLSLLLKVIVNAGSVYGCVKTVLHSKQGSCGDWLMYIKLLPQHKLRN